MLNNLHSYNSTDQQEMFSSSFSRYHYMTSEKYFEHIQWRKKRFLKDWSERNWLSWNLADWRAYELLKKNRE